MRTEKGGATERLYTRLLIAMIAAAAVTVLLNALDWHYWREEQRVQRELFMLPYTNSTAKDLQNYLIRANRANLGSGINTRNQLANDINGGKPFRQRVMKGYVADVWTDSKSGLVVDFIFADDGSLSGWNFRAASQIPESLQNPSQWRLLIKSLVRQPAGFFGDWPWGAAWLFVAVLWLGLEGLNADIATKYQIHWFRLLTILCVGVVTSSLLSMFGPPAPGSVTGVGIIPVVIGIHLFVWHRLRSGVPTSDFPACTACGYNLTGNLSGVCPECGSLARL